jgi:hypothetical protein
MPETYYKRDKTEKPNKVGKQFIFLIIMAKSAPRPADGPSTTGIPSGSGRGNNPHSK